jgi:hypothetical protein
MSRICRLNARWANRFRSPDSVAPENPQQVAAVDNFNADSNTLLHSLRPRAPQRLPARAPIRSVTKYCPLSLRLLSLLHRRPGKRSDTRRKITSERKPT